MSAVWITSSFILTSVFQIKGRIVSCQSCTKRNNSCVKYINNDVTQYGVLKKVVFLNELSSTSQCCYALVQQL